MENCSRTSDHIAHPHPVSPTFSENHPDAVFAPSDTRPRWWFSSMPKLGHKLRSLYQQQRRLQQDVQNTGDAWRQRPRDVDAWPLRAVLAGRQRSVRLPTAHRESNRGDQLDHHDGVRYPTDAPANHQIRHRQAESSTSAPLCSTPAPPFVRRCSRTPHRPRRRRAVEAEHRRPGIGFEHSTSTSLDPPLKQTLWRLELTLEENNAKQPHPAPRRWQRRQAALTSPNSPCARPPRGSARGRLDAGSPNPATCQ